MNNFSTEELSHFSNLSEYWWDTEGPLRTLHDINSVRLDFILNHTNLLEKKVLDLGCGGGILSEALAKSGATVTAIDLEKNAIDVANKHAEKSHVNINYQCISIEDLSNKEQANYDVITCMEMLEHVPHPEKIIHYCAKLLKPQGKLFLSTINRTWKAYGFAIIGAEYVLDLVPKHTHQYEKFIKPSELAEWLRHEKLSLTALNGLNYNPLLHKATLSECVEVNYLIMAEF